jgi:drug/metabolite transporter (DMT)-like permease
MSQVREVSDARTWAIFCGIAAAIIWGGGSVVSRYLVSSGAAPVDLTLIRYLVCFPLGLVAIAVWPAARPRIPWPRLLVLTLLAGPPYQFLLLAGYGHATAGAGALLVTGLMPVAACLIGWLAPGPRPATEAWIGAGIGLVGLGLFAQGLTDAHLDARGVLVFSMAAVAWALLGRCARTWSVDPLQLTVALALSSPLFLPAWFLTTSGSLPSIGLAHLALQGLYHGTFVAFVATALYFIAIRGAGAETAACLQAATPVFAAALGASLLDEPLTPTQAAGAVIVTLGIVVAATGKRLTAWHGRQDGKSTEERSK